MLAVIALGALAVLAPRIALAVWVALLVLAVAVLADWVLTPDPARLAMTRTVPERAGLGVEFQRVLRVEPGRAAGLWLEVREEHSDALEPRARAWPRGGGGDSDDDRDSDLDGDAHLDGGVDARALAPLRAGDPTGGPDGAWLRGGAAIELARAYAGVRRGVASLGHLRLRLRGPLGLVLRQTRLGGRSEIAIRPALLGLSRTLQLAASQRWRDLGVRRVRRRGGLTEFEALREYVPGDEVRMVDWKAFARRGRPMVREHQEEHGQELVLVVDCGRRMVAAGGEGAQRGWTKLDHALDAALQMAAVALQEGDRVGVLAFDARVRAWVAPARGARQLARIEEAVFALTPARAESDHELALREIGARQRRRATLIVLSDVADPLSVDVQVRALATGARRHRVLFAALDDPELRRAAAGATPVGAAVRAGALVLADERRASLARLRASGAVVLDALPAEAAAPVLAAWLDARRAGL